MHETIQLIYDFWFGDILTNADAPMRKKLWFMGGETVDKQIRNKFEPLIVDARSHQLDHWAQSPRGSTALIILLDQFPLNIYRGDARAYVAEKHSVDICLKGIANGQDSGLTFFECMFFYMPLQHSESAQHQQLSIEHFTALRDRAPRRNIENAEATLGSAVDHKATVDRFGRYPHRNKVLGRESTPQEIAYLDSGGATYGQ